MRASALGNSSFGGWAQQCDDETGETCRFYMTTGQHDTVYAGFSVAPVDATGTLEISRAGTGSGNVASSASPIQGCAADEGVRCEVHRGGRPVVLRATPSFGSRFGGWSEDCEFRESATCALAVAGVRAVTATFTTVHDLTVTVNTGGSVTAISHGIDCPGACSAVVDGGESVTLTAGALDGFTFGGWGEACAGESSTTCQITMNRDRTVDGQFAGTVSLTVSVSRPAAGPGAETGVFAAIAPQPPRISCGPQCTSASAPFAIGAGVTLSVIPAPPDDRLTWGGPCTGTTGPICIITLGGADATVPVTIR